MVDRMGLPGRKEELRDDRVDLGSRASYPASATTWT